MLDYPVLFNDDPSVVTTYDLKIILESLKKSTSESYFYHLILVRRFNELKTAWTDETQFLSSFEAAYSNENYQKVIQLGSSVIPILLADMKENNTFWFRALEILTGCNPVKQEHFGLVNEMIGDWLEWYDKTTK